MRWPPPESRAWLFGSEAISRLCSLALFAVVARSMTARELGLFAIAAASAATGQAVAPALVGKPLANLPEGAQRRDAAPAAFSLAAFAGLLVFAVLAVIAAVVRGEAGIALVGCGAGVAATLLFEGAFWVRIFTHDARSAGVRLATINLSHLALVAAIRPLLPGVALVPGTYLLLLACAAIGSVGVPRPEPRRAWEWLTGHWRRWLPYVTGNGSALVLAQSLPLLLTLVAGLEAASSFRGAEILFGGSNLVTSVLVLTTLASTRYVGRRALLASLATSTGVVALNATALWLVPTSLIVLIVGPVAPVVRNFLAVLTLQRLALAGGSLVSVALVSLVPARVVGLLQTGGALLCATSVIIGGLSAGLGGAFFALAVAEVIQTGAYLVVYLRATPPSDRRPFRRGPQR